MSLLSLPLSAAVLLADGSATPTLRQGLDADQVGPGTIGFVMTFLMAALVVLLVLDHTRRQRRLKNRFDYAMRREEEERAAREGEAAEEPSDRTV